MALFNRLFQSRKASKSERSNQEDVKPFTFNTGQVRVLLFRECEWRGRKLLYDSSAVEKVSLDNTKIVSKCFSNNKSDEIKEKFDGGISNDLNILERSNGFGFQCKVMNSDAVLLGEMIFGSVAMNYKGMSLKVHILNAPQRLMYTKVYCSPGRRRCQPHTSDTSRHTSISSDSAASISDVLHKTAAQVTDLCSSSYCNSADSSVPFQVSVLNMEDHLSVNWSVNKDDSGFCSEFSSHSSIGCNCSDSNSCIWDKENCTNHAEELFNFGNSGDTKESNIPRSLQWRLNHHMSASLEYSAMSSDSSTQVTPNSKDPQVSTNNVRSTTSESLTNNSGKSSYQRKEKMGLAIVITLTEKIESQMMRFLMEHAVLVEGALSRLRLAVRDALSKPRAFITNMTTATQEAAQWLVDLLTCPRIGAPLWSFLSCSQKRTVGDKIADIFLKDLCSLLCSMDTKDTYFFMSTLITNVLTHHLGWVNSVSPYNISSLSQQKELDILNNIYPYNPLWAQLGELYGVIGTPARISRTIIYGKQNTCIVKKILNVLSYFIRCGEVKRLSVKTKPVPWDSIDYFMKNYNTENIVSEHCIKKDESKNLTGDMIEMKTFKVTTNQPCAFKELKPRSIDTNLHIKKFAANPILHKSVESCSDSKHNCKLKSSLKRNVSTNKLHNAFSKTSNGTLVSSDSSIHSICTLRPVDSSESCSNETDENKCFQPTNRSLKNIEINSSEILSKVNKLCRVSTSNILCHVANGINEVYGKTDPIEESTPPNINVKLDCDKQITVNEEIYYNSSNIIKSSKIVNSDSANDLRQEINILRESSYEKNVVFVLGEDEVLEGLKKISPKNQNSEIEKSCNTKCAESVITGTDITEPENKRCKSYPRENTSSVTSDVADRLSLQRDTCCMRKPQCKHSKFKKHSGVKFEFEKYPQIVTNYMKSKNLELLDRHVIGKPGNLKIDAFEFEAGSSILSVPEDSDTCINCSFNGQSLQTPSNASELEYTCDIPDQREIQFAKEKNILPTIVTHVEPNTPPKVFIKQKLEQTLVINSTRREPTVISIKQLQSECESPTYDQLTALSQNESVEFPLPVMAVSPECDEIATGYCHSLLGGITDHYVSDLVLQGGVGGQRDDWERLLRRDLALQGGATCLLADIDDGSVRAWGGGACGMSALVASMLDSLPQMYYAKVPPTQCLAYIESKLKELCVRSKTLAQLLMEKDFCDMDYLTKTLNLDPNDVPLLLAIASTHSPEVSLKYGVSYR